MIRFYLGEEPILEQVPTYVCARARRRAVRARAPRRAGGQGGRRGGRLRHADGPAGDAPPSATSSARRIIAEPRKYIAQHRIELSTCPTWIAERSGVEPRRVDLRPLHPRPRTRAAPLGAARRPDARRAARRLVRRQLEPGRRLEGHLGAGGAAVVISRVADHCFWFGRYLERAESTARLLQVTRTLAFDAELPPRSAGGRW